MTDLIYQPIPDSDFAQIARTDVQAGFSSAVQQTLDWLAQPRERDLRGLYRGDRIVAQLAIFPFALSTGAAELPCGGLGGLTTPPEERRQGRAARLLRESCDELLGRGAPLCLLYPSKTSLFARYGWATFAERAVYRGAPALLGHFRRQRQGRWEPIGQGSIPALDQVYRAALRGRFGPQLRSELWWRANVLGVPPAERLGYLWRDEQGGPRAYLLYRLERLPGGRALHCREIAALDPTARGQVFALLAQHEDQVEEVIFRAPSDEPVNLLMPSPLRCEVEPHAMLRLLDVAAALSGYGYPPDAQGRLTIAVADSWLARNQGVFELEVADGAAQCRRLAGSTQADLACDVRVLTQLIARSLRPRTAAAFGLLGAHSRPGLALAERLFAGPAPFNSDHF